MLIVAENKRCSADGYTFGIDNIVVHCNILGSCSLNGINDIVSRKVVYSVSQVIINNPTATAGSIESKFRSRVSEHSIINFAIAAVFRIVSGHEICISSGSECHIAKRIYRAARFGMIVKEIAADFAKYSSGIAKNGATVFDSRVPNKITADTPNGFIQIIINSAAAFFSRVGNEIPGDVFDFLGVFDSAAMPQCSIADEVSVNFINGSHTAIVNSTAAIITDIAVCLVSNKITGNFVNCSFVFYCPSFKPCCITNEISGNIADLPVMVIVNSTTDCSCRISDKVAGNILNYPITAIINCAAGAVCAINMIADEITG